MISYFIIKDYCGSFDFMIVWQNMFAIIETGGKQYRIEQGKRLKIERLSGELKNPVIFDKVLLKSDREEVIIGQPYIKDSSVEAEILSHSRYDKKIVFRYHSKTRERKKKGHRQHYTEILISKIK